MPFHTPIAVTGMAGIFPGAPNLGYFWENIVSGRDAVAPVRPQRWTVSPRIMVQSDPLPDRSYSDRCCLIDEPAKLLPGMDAEFYKALDPLHRLVLQTGEDLLQSDGGLPEQRDRTGLVLAAIALPTEGASRLAGHILGNAFKDRLFEKGPHGDAPAVHDLERRCLAARVTAYPGELLSRSLALGAGSYTLDAACASSLYAVKLACDTLIHDRAEAMIAGGVSRPDCLYTQVGFSQLKALSRSGRCSAFDAAADGLVVGEGCGLLVLKRLEDAIAAGNHIYGVIRGIGLSNDIQGSLLAPAGEGQLRAMQMAYERAGWSPADVDLIECHGAGTPVGDSVEVHSMVRLWEAVSWQAGQCAMGSVKTMIGHLLTAAGAAGMIKTLLAMENRTLPPSLNFSEPPSGSPLEGSPFRVLNRAAPWKTRHRDTPRRAAVSAFGFGGINAHLLLEQWRPAEQPKPSVKKCCRSEACIQVSQHRSLPQQDSQEPIAVVGMGAFFGRLSCLADFEEAVFTGKSAIAKRPPARWLGTEQAVEAYLQGSAAWGAYIDRFDLDLSEFSTPPREIPEILPQQLLMIKTGAEAMKDAGLPLRAQRPRMGTVIGIAFDMQATDFHVRWTLENQVRQWIQDQRISLTDRERNRWLNELKDSLAPALNATRTLGALGSVAASRMAKHFGLGGSSFAVSSEESSGLTALDIAVRALQQHEMDAVLAGAVDLAGDIRSVLVQNTLVKLSGKRHIRPFDARADGTLPGEGAAALVLKRLEDALADGNRIYALVRGTGFAAPTPSDAAPETYIRSLENTFKACCLPPETVSYVEAHGSGDPSQDRVEAEALQCFFSSLKTAGPLALGSVKPVVGHTGAAAGLASVVKTCLCLYRRIIPPLANFNSAPQDLWTSDCLHIPVSAQYWVNGCPHGPRRALTATFSPEGQCGHALMEEPPVSKNSPNGRTIEDRMVVGADPVPGLRSTALFIIDAPQREALQDGINKLKRKTARWSSDGLSLEVAARRWYAEYPPDLENPVAIALVSTAFDQLESQLSAVAGRGNGLPTRGLYITPRGEQLKGGVAFVYPGSGNQYLGMMGRLGVCWPDVFSRLNRGSIHFERQMRPAQTIPWRRDWSPGWEKEAEAALGDPLNVICTQIIFGMAMTKVVRQFGLQPHAAIGYSLGESAALFSLGVWNDRDLMMERALDSDLFTRQLAGPCLAARRAWHISPDAEFQWATALINCPASSVRERLADFPLTRLLIINTGQECVIGGESGQVRQLIRVLPGDAVFLKGVTSVHCEAMQPVSKAYRDLHLLDTASVPGIEFYGCATADVYTPTREFAADAILQQALHGFDFPALIHRAYRDGIRIFLEMGPQNSCTRMINTLLDRKPHLATSASMRGHDEFEGVLRFLAELTAWRIPVSLDSLYGTGSGVDVRKAPESPTVTVSVGRSMSVAPRLRAPFKKVFPSPRPATVPPAQPAPENASGFMEQLVKGSRASAEVHRNFLNVSHELFKTYTQTLSQQSRLYTGLLQQQKSSGGESAKPAPAFSRDMCMEFAVGRVAQVLGPEFSPVDSYRVRVRLPDEPLMLVDRILTVSGEKGSLTAGTVVTEHDVLPDVWYLDGGRAPVCISVEAGQADLFLCAYLGIDLAVKGQRAYRLLDAEVTFHRGLPRPGETIRYEIHIDRFVQQGETWLFFFRFDGTINGRALITMRNGCAGFFTAEEIETSGGIVTTEEEKLPTAGCRPTDWKIPAPFPGPVACSEQQLAALRLGDLAQAFGSAFTNKRLSPSLRLPDGRMKLIDRVLEMEPSGGRYGLGRIRAEADIHPADWFLTCHFVDDRVMPGTLMYECCAHTLRVFLQRLGWISGSESAFYEPVPGVCSRLKCRGPVTPETRRVVYEVEIRELGYDPEPYAVADAHMYADGRYIVRFEDMSIKMTGVSRSDIEALWSESHLVCDRHQIEEYAFGRPSRCFGEAYRVFDEGRFLARLPSPPFLFVDRVTTAEPPPLALKPGGWIESEHDLSSRNWYFSAERTGSMPYSVLLEGALQPCGWLAAFLGSALRSERKLQFRNLGGTATIHEDVTPAAGLMRMRARLTDVSEAAAMIIEHFDFQVFIQDQTVYTGSTYFGFFNPLALAQQRGIADATERVWQPPEALSHNCRTFDLEAVSPLTPQEAGPWKNDYEGLQLPAKALCMLDRIDCYLPDGGPHGLGFIRGAKTVDPDEWFFKAHFYQDPVWPGSLGIEAFILLLKYAALQRWPQRRSSSRFSLVTGREHRWVYRGQVTPDAHRVEVEAVVTQVTPEPHATILASGFLKVDGLYIYEMQDFGICLTPLNG